MSASETVINLHAGDAFDVLETLDDESIHAVVSDPPYGLAFMGNDWDDFEPEEYQQWCEEWAEECLRVLKPGGHLLAFSGSRTHHRLFTGIEDAGYEVRDTITWHYGSGFPKGTSIDQHIDRYHDAEDEREVVGSYEESGRGSASVLNDDSSGFGSGEITAPATDIAKRWEGWNTQLKPATEFVVLAQKPLSENAIYKNCLEHETGALNIDGCRIPTNDNLSSETGGGFGAFQRTGKRDADGDDIASPDLDGRYPANLVLSDDVADDMNEQAGKEVSRYFYSPKAQKSERTHDGEVENDHPTVKPVDLLAYLTQLVTREGQTVLDPFAGSGTTGLAATRENRSCVLIEREEEYVDIARERLLLERTLEGGDTFELKVHEHDPDGED